MSRRALGYFALGIASLAAGWCGTASAERTQISADRQEILEDPYAVPDDPPITAPAQVWVRGRFASVQVNVDSQGHNVVGDAANEPSIAVDPTDGSRMAIGWRQFDRISSNFRQAGRAYSQDGGQTWTFPGVIEPGVFRSDPVLDADADGNFYYYSLTLIGSSTFVVHMFKSTDGGITWSTRVFAAGGDKAWMTVDRTEGPGRGHIYAQWNRNFSCCNGDFARSIDGGQSFEQPINVPTNPFWGTLSVGPDGELYVAGNGFVVARSDNAQDPLVTPSFDSVSFVDLGGFLGFSGPPNPAGLLGQAWVATDHSSGPTRGNVYLLASVNPAGPDPLDVMFARSTDGGVTWSQPARVNDDASNTSAWQWFGTMSVAPNGRIDAIWNDTRNTGAANLSELFYSFSTDAGLTWSQNIPVSPVFNSYLGWPNQSKIGDYYDMVSDDLGVDIAYAATFNGEQDVYFLRLTQDCNGNGIPDTEDIDAGTSDDCNGNRFPDECEPDLDCNDNGVQDICDVAAGTSPDCNDNDVPDECDPDCDANGVVDDCEVDDGTALDCNRNGVPDNCDITAGVSPDCNENGIPDVCDIGGGNVPFADTCDAAVSVCPGVTYSGTTAGASNDGSANCAFSADTPDVWYRYTPNTDGTLQVSLCGSSYDTAVSVHTACPGDFSNEVVCNDDACGLQSIVSMGVNAGVDYWIRVSGYFGSIGNFTMQLAGPDCGASLVDCDDNGVPDECELDTDCNTNGVLDICEPDCDGNGLPDECEPDLDCNTNGILDICEPECNGNGVPDECDLAAETSSDCNNNGIPDECDGTPASWRSATLSPIGGESPQSFRIRTAPPAVADVTLGFSAAADLDFVFSERIIIHLNGTVIGEVFGGLDDHHCPQIPDTDQLTIPAALFNDLVAGGDALIEMVPTAEVAADDCNQDSYITVSVEFQTLSDCNTNGVLDLCDLADGFSDDCNADGVPDECERDCNQNGITDDCDPDFDCNGNTVQDICDVALATSPDCNGNTVPDECDIDFDLDGTIDDCDGCPVDPNKVAEGQCGCGELDDDIDLDGVADCNDGCPADVNKIEPGRCGCGRADEGDTDGDGVLDCVDQCRGVDDAIFAPECAVAIPAVSSWGLVILALLLLAGSKIYAGLIRPARKS